MLEVRAVPAFQDNLLWLLRCTATGQTAAVDPGDAEPILQALGDQPLHQILLTHHHPDHIGGVDELRDRTGAQVLGFDRDRHRLPRLDRALEEGEEVRVGQQVATVLFLPAHTLGHIAYHFARAEALFCGDTLFLMGCGRLFEGDAAMLWAAMTRLRALPPATRIYCAHEYTLTNARFAVEVDPQNEALRARLARVQALRAQGLATVPGGLAEERLTNPFLRADAPELASALAMEGASPVEITAALRQRRNTFR
jgi:hydroxyacylglutathione hydrolase